MITLNDFDIEDEDFEGAMCLVGVELVAIGDVYCTLFCQGEFVASIHQTGEFQVIRGDKDDLRKDSVFIKTLVSCVKDGIEYGDKELLIIYKKVKKC